MAQDARVEAILRRAADLLAGVPGVEGVVLGGSRATGAATPDSDIDIGIYYEGAHPPGTAALSAVAARLDDAHRPHLVMPIGSWGPWVDAGGWLTVCGLPVDFILRDLRRVQAEIENCRQGKVTCHYQTGHPHAFLNAIYMGEIAVCRIFADPHDHLRPLQAVARDYPDALQAAMLHSFLFETGFSLMLAERTVTRGDDCYVAGHVIRAISTMNQVLFALNRTYCLGEKHAVRRIDGFAIHPRDYGARVQGALAMLGPASAAALADLSALLAEVRALAGAE